MEDLERQSFFSWLLSHHPVDRWHLCYRFSIAGRYYAVCARCLGIFGAGTITFLIGRLTGPWPPLVEWLILMLPPLPALIDWSTTTVSGKPERKNWIRLLTGAGMGIGIGGALHVNSYALLNQPVSAQFLFVVGTVFLVRVVAYLRFGLRRTLELRKRLRKRPSLEEYIRSSFENQSASPKDEKKN